MSQDQRKRKYVEQKVQGALVRRVVLHFCVFVIAGAFFGLVLQFLTNPFQSQAQLFRTFWANSGPYLAALVCLVPVFVMDTIKLSHRIAGPICRLKNTIDGIAEGDANVAPLKFRKTDMWPELPASFNAMVDKLSTQRDGRTDEASLDQIQKIVDADIPAESK